MEEKLDERPKQRIWNGGDYESDDEDEKPRRRNLNSDGYPTPKSETR